MVDGVDELVMASDGGNVILGSGLARPSQSNSRYAGCALQLVKSAACSYVRNSYEKLATEYASGGSLVALGNTSHFLKGTTLDVSPLVRTEIYKHDITGSVYWRLVVVVSGSMYYDYIVTMMYIMAGLAPISVGLVFTVVWRMYRELHVPSGLFVLIVVIQTIYWASWVIAVKQNTNSGVEDALKDNSAM